MDLVEGVFLCVVGAVFLGRLFRTLIGVTAYARAGALPTWLRKSAVAGVVGLVLIWGGLTLLL